MKKQNQKGFTLAELLIVVAIIAILVAIAIPVFTKRLEASRETTDIANLRSAYAVATVAVMSGKKDITAKSMYFHPNNSTGLTTAPTTSASKSKIKIGKGTSYPGGADTNTLPDVVKYSTTSGVAGYAIKITFDGSLDKAGKVNSIEFAELS